MTFLPSLDDIDYQLISALQIYPRASWAHLASVLSSTPSTISRRWEKLTSAGLAWTSATLIASASTPRSQVAFIEATCASGQRESAIANLSLINEVISIECLAGNRDLMLTVLAKSIGDVDRLVNQHITLISGLIRTRTHYASHIISEGSSYRFGGLSADQRRHMNAIRPVRSLSATANPTPTQERIVEALADNARRSASEIARRSGLSSSHVQRQLLHIEKEPWFLCRTDISPVDFGLIAVYLWVQAPVDKVNNIVTFAHNYPGIRLLASIVSRTNLLISLWVPGLEHVSGFELDLTHALPDVDIVDRWLQTSMRKRIGVVLDENGRALPERS